jgi:hypothetical protein
MEHICLTKVLANGKIGFGWLLLIMTMYRVIGVYKMRLFLNGNLVLSIW